MNGKKTKDRNRSAVSNATQRPSRRRTERIHCSCTMEVMGHPGRGSFTARVGWKSHDSELKSDGELVPTMAERLVWDSCYDWNGNKNWIKYTKQLLERASNTGAVSLERRKQRQ